jgi:hypothetical protein
VFIGLIAEVMLPVLRSGDCRLPFESYLFMRKGTVRSIISTIFSWTWQALKEERSSGNPIVYNPAITEARYVSAWRLYLQLTK